MRVLRHLLLGLLACTALAFAERLQPRAVESWDAPVPFHCDEKAFSLAAALVQNTYCSRIRIGEHVGDAKLLWRAGDGNWLQKALVYHSPSLGVALALEGTNGSSLWSTARDLEYPLVDPDRRYKHAVPHGAKVFYGFQAAYIDLADRVKAHVEKALKQYNETRVTVIGHSLGAAMGLIAACHLEATLKHGVHRVLLFGLPRTGNPQFASYVDQTFGDRFHFIVNGRDWVPHIPDRIFGYQHPSNLVWINPANSTNYTLYQGQENVHGINKVPIWKWNGHDHTGIYFQTLIGGDQYHPHCPARVGDTGDNHN